MRCYSPYILPELYEIAFSFRDYPQAIEFITLAAQKAGLAKIKSMVELGCGPGQYCCEFARNGVKAYGVDLSPEMVAYTKSKCQKEKLECTIIEADFRNFHLEQPVDLAVCMMATFGYLLSNKDIIKHFFAVANNLTENGIYLIELPHPRDVYDPHRSIKNYVWDMEKDGIKVHTDWGSDGEFDQITEIDSATVKISYDIEGEKGSIESPDYMRRLGVNTFISLLVLTDLFEISSTYGDLNINQPFDNSKNSWRMIPVLRKKDIDNF